MKEELDQYLENSGNNDDDGNEDDIESDDLESEDDEDEKPSKNQGSVQFVDGQGGNIRFYATFSHFVKAGSKPHHESCALMISLPFLAGTT
jgi:hypothetical protein